MKVLAFLVITALCLIVAFLPELAMYFTWHLVAPQSDIARILLVVLFWVAGGGACIFFGIISFMAWIALVGSLSEF